MNKGNDWWGVSTRARSEHIDEKHTAKMDYCVCGRSARTCCAAENKGFSHASSAVDRPPQREPRCTSGRASWRREELLANRRAGASSRMSCSQDNPAPTCLLVWFGHAHLLLGCSPTSAFPSSWPRSVSSASSSAFSSAGVEGALFGFGVVLLLWTHASVLSRTVPTAAATSRSEKRRGTAPLTQRIDRVLSTKNRAVAAALRRLTLTFT